MTHASLAHSLKTRHILMIALGSAIGTGLFFGAGKSISLTGPSVILSYVLGGLMMYIVIRALGEMTVYEPNPGSFSYYANKYVGHYLGFISGWNYWFNYIIVCMLELTASTMFLDYWFNFPHWISSLVILVVFGIINLLSVKIFGELEFWLSGIKVLTIIMMIAFGCYLIFFHHNLPSQITPSVTNLWVYNNFFAGGIKGFLFSFVVVIFSFGGTELVGIAASESKNPRKDIPLAINGVILRIIIFYVATITIVLCLYPWNKIDSNISPFVDVFSKIGINKAATVINIIALSAALSSLNSGIYGTARMMYSLANSGSAFKVFAKLSKNKVPYYSILLSLTFIFITVILNYLYPTHIFFILLAIATIAAIINWLIILATHISFRYKTMFKDIKYKLPFFPITSIITIIFFIIIAIIMTQIEDMKLAIYLAPLWALILTLAYCIKKRQSHKAL